MTQEDKARLVAERRLARVRIDVEFPLYLARELGARHELIDNALPATAAVLAAEVVDPWPYLAGEHRDALEVVLVDESFEPVADGVEVPLLPSPLFRRVTAP